MKITKSTRENLKKDKLVLGKNWKKTYKGFFGNKKNIDQFVKITLPYFLNKQSISIFYPASANGGLGEELAKELRKKGIKTKLTINDVSKKHLKENTNKKTKKICADLLKLRLKEKFDLIIMRSSLDYFPNKKLQTRILGQIRNWLKKEGVFINQIAALNTNHSRDCADCIYNSTKRMGKRHFQSMGDIKQIYKKAGFKILAVISGPKLIITAKEHKNRYKITKKDVEKIKSIIKKFKTREIKATKKGYKIKFTFPIIIAKKLILNNQKDY